MERYKICKGKPLKIANLKMKYDPLTEKSWWVFSVPMNTKNGAFEFIRVKVEGRCPFEEGNKVRVVDILSYHSTITYGLNGGRHVFRTLECTVEPYKKIERDNDDEEDYE